MKVFSGERVPCSTVLLWGGSWGSWRTLRAAEDVTEEEREEPPWRWPLTERNTKEKPKKEPKGGKQSKDENKSGIKRQNKRIVTQDF